MGMVWYIGMYLYIGIVYICCGSVFIDTETSESHATQGFLKSIAAWSLIIIDIHISVCPEAGMQTASTISDFGKLQIFFLSYTGTLSYCFLKKKEKNLYCLWDYLKERQRASWGVLHNTASMVMNWGQDARSRRRYKDIRLPKMDQTLVHTQQTQNQCPWLTQESDLGLVIANSKFQSSSTLKSR